MEELMYHNCSFAEYISSIYLGYIWGDSVMIAALANMWNVKVEILRPGEKSMKYFDTGVADIVLVGNGGDQSSGRPNSHFSGSIITGGNTLGQHAHVTKKCSTALGCSESEIKMAEAQNVVIERKKKRELSELKRLISKIEAKITKYELLAHTSAKNVLQRALHSYQKKSNKATYLLKRSAESNLQFAQKEEHRMKMKVVLTTFFTLIQKMQQNKNYEKYDFFTSS